MQHKGESLRPGCPSCHCSLHRFPATTATSLWSPVLETEHEREEVDEPSHAKRLLAPFPRPTLLPPESRPRSPLLRLNLPPRRCSEPHHHPMRLPRLHHRCHPRGGDGEPYFATAKVAATVPVVGTNVTPSAVPLATPPPDAPSPPPPPLSPPRR